jgi:hypothetical protein
MIPTPTGLVIILLGCWCLLGGHARILIVAVALTTLEAADAADLPALGGASITPVRLFLLFIILKLIRSKDGVTLLFAELSSRRVLFIYLLLLMWVLASALFLPRLFNGMTLVYSLQRYAVDTGLIPVPLVPSSGNITQAVYATGSFVLSVGVAAIVRQNEGFSAILSGLLLVTGLDIGFAIADLVTSATNTGFLLNFVHTANYALLTADEAGGLKRIAGSFTEASSFASFSLVLLAVNLSLFLLHVRPRLTGSYALALLVLLLLSTSTTAYVGVAVFAAVFVGYVLYALIRHADAGPLFILGCALGFLAVGIAILTFTAPSLLSAAWDLIDTSVFKKSTSESAEERGMLNQQALRIFFDTYGIGAGIGATRTSNYVLLLASNLGVIGLVLFGCLMMALVIVPLRRELTALDRKVVTAARVGMVAALVPALLISTIFDLGPLFYILVGVIAAGAAAPFAPEVRAVDWPRSPPAADMRSRGGATRLS